MNKVSATTKGVRVSTRKVRLVADSVRNMSAKDAVITLSLINKRGAGAILKTIKSAIANAVTNAKLSEDSLVIDALEVQEGPFLKRFHASTRGRVHPYKKRGSHITVTLKESKGSNEPKETKVEEKKEEKNNGKKD